MTIETVFFDRDGVINDVVMRGTVISAPRGLNEFHIRPDFISFYKLLPPSLGLFVVSNQPDIARELLPINELEQMHEQLKSKFSFKEIVYCPHDNADNCECRKPKPGMINEILSRYQLTTNTAILIGDSEKDILAGQAAGIKTVYLQHTYNPRPECSPNFVINQLNDMLKIIDSV